jgi:trehalose synthase
MQMPPGSGGYVVDTDDEFTQRVSELLADRESARDLGSRGRAHIRHHFLTTRLLADELRLLGSLEIP